MLGREVRAGCVIPTIAGGICQISNALATCATSASPKKLPASPVIPLRLIEPSGQQHKPVARGCLTCEEWSCYLHRPQDRGRQAREAWLLDAWTPEFDHWLHAQAQRRANPPDRFLPTLPAWMPGRHGDIQRWLSAPADASEQIITPITTFPVTGLRRMCGQRLLAYGGGVRQAGIVMGQRWLARAYARRLQPEHAHLVIDQGLLAPLQQLGVPGGRSYDVLAAALPMGEIERRLDQAQRQRPAQAPQDSTDSTLTDFRADPALVAAEMAAMWWATRIITPHAAVAEYWSSQGLTVERLPWQRPLVPQTPQALQATREKMQEGLPLLVFPASVLPRKGIAELVCALQGLNVRLLILSSPPANASLLQNLKVEYGSYRDDWIVRAAAVVLPAYVEHNPHALLSAVTAGIPVIATSACGLTEADGARLVPAGDVEALRREIQAVL